MKKACVIGAGLYGSQIATALEDKGYTTLIIDDRRPLAGSDAAACLVKENWILPSLGPEVVGHAYSWLHRYKAHYTILDRACFFEPTDILRGDYIQATVVRVMPDGYGGTVTVDIHDPNYIPDPQFVIGDGNKYEVSTHFDVVVVAAGAWTEKLLEHFPNHGVKVFGKIGTALTWNTPKGKFMAPCFIKEWAPYKQIVGLQRGKDYWLGDGTAMLQRTYTKDRKTQSVQRCLKALSTYGDEVAFPDHIIDGLRPYTPEPIGVCKQIHPGVWVATGARKNGTVLGAYCAVKIRSEVP